MFEFRRFLWVLTIPAFLITATGCSSYGLVHGPGDSDSLPPAVDWTRIIESGDKVRVTFEDDRTIEGQVVDLSPDSFVVETKVKRLVEPEDHYKTTIIEFVTIGAGDDIRFIEKPQFSLGKTLILVGAIAAPIVAIGLTSESPDFTVFAKQ